MRRVAAGSDGSSASSSRTGTRGSQPYAPRFADAFVGADEVVITDIYAAWETPVPGVSGRQIFDAVRAAHPEVTMHYVPDRTELAAELGDIVRPGDCLLMLGAGDITEVTAALLDRSTERAPR